MKTFLIIWIGQLVSRIGTAMTRFALIIWAYQQTGEATTIALLGFASFVPMVVASPFAGVWVDRLDRRRVMQLTDLGAGLITLILLSLHTTGDLEIWYLYLAAGLAGSFEAFQIPAYTAASSILLPKEAYARASGLRSLAEFGGDIAAPILGGLLLTASGIGAVMVFDVATFVIALATLVMVRVPPPAPAPNEKGTPASFNRELRVGFHYIRRRPGLLAFALVMTAINLFANLTWFSIMPAMVLARSGNDELALASVQSAMGVGGLLGAILIGLWGGPRNRVHGMLLGIITSFVVGDMVLAVGRTAPMWMIAAASGAFFIPLIRSSYEAIWQSKVNPALQGRVFSVRDMMTRSTAPVGYLLGGILADHVMEPALAAGGPLAPTLGRLVGTGPGAGMALMFLLSATIAIALCLGAYLVPAVRRVDHELPDHDLVQAGAPLA